MRNRRPASESGPVEDLFRSSLENQIDLRQDGPTGTPIDNYGYDPTGNRTSTSTSTSTTAYTYPATRHRPASVGGTARTLDAAGSTTAIDGMSAMAAYADIGGGVAFSPGEGRAWEVGVGLGVSAAGGRGTGGVGADSGYITSRDGWAWSW
jgi:hypothetical protein